MIRLTATRNLNDITITASVELADGATDLPGKLRTLVDHVTAVAAKPPGTGHSQPPVGQPPYWGTPNGNGDDHGDGISPKQRSSALVRPLAVSFGGAPGGVARGPALSGPLLAIQGPAAGEARLRAPEKAEPNSYAIGMEKHKAMSSQDRGARVAHG